MSDEKKDKINFDIDAFLRAVEHTKGEFNNFTAIMNAMTAHRLGILGEIGNPRVIVGSIPDDKVVMVKTDMTRRQLDARRELNFDFEDIDEQIRERMNTYLYQSFFYGRYWNEYSTADKEPYWHRGENESLRDWGTRLVASGAMDIFEVRWTYQKAVLGMPWRWLKRLLKR